MTAPRSTPSRGSPLSTALSDPSPSTAALEQRRFERDVEQARQVLAALALPLAAFGITDALVAAGKPKKVAIIACMRNILDAVHYVARTRTAFVQKVA